VPAEKAAVSQPKQQETNDRTVAPSPAMDGIWHDTNLGTVFRVSQRGNSFDFTASHPDFDSSGTGTMAGGSVESRYQNFNKNGARSSGVCSGRLLVNPNQITLTCTDSQIGAWSTTLTR
jgi:hypothetical protein